MNFGLTYHIPAAAAGRERALNEIGKNVLSVFITHKSIEKAQLLV